MTRQYTTELADRAHMLRLHEQLCAQNEEEERLRQIKRYKELQDELDEITGFAELLDKDEVVSGDKLAGGVTFGAIVTLAVLRTIFSKKQQSKDKQEPEIPVRWPQAVEEWNNLFGEMRKQFYQDDPKQFNWFARKVKDRILFEDHKLVDEEDAETNASGASGYISNLRVVNFLRRRGVFSFLKNHPSIQALIGAGKTVKTASSKAKEAATFMMDEDPRTKSSSALLNKGKSGVIFGKKLSPAITAIMFLATPVALFAPVVWALPVAVGGGLLLYGAYRYNRYRKQKSASKPTLDIVTDKEKQLFQDVKRYLTLKAYYQNTLTQLQASELAIGMRSIPEHICTVDQEVIEQAVIDQYKRRRWVKGVFGQIAIVGTISIVANAILSASMTDIALSAANFLGVAMSPATTLGVFLGFAAATLIVSTIMAVQQHKKLNKELSRKESAELLYHTLLHHKQVLQQKNAILDQRLERIDSQLPEHDHSRNVPQVNFDAIKTKLTPKKGWLDKGVSHMASFIGGSSKTAKLFRIVFFGGMFGALFTGIPTGPIVAAAIAIGLVIGLFKVYQAYKKRQETDDKALIDSLESRNHELKREVELLNKRACIRSVQLLDQEDKRAALQTVPMEQLRESASALNNAPTLTATAQAQPTFAASSPNPGKESTVVAVDARPTTQAALNEVLSSDTVFMEAPNLKPI